MSRSQDTHWFLILDTTQRFDLNGSSFFFEVSVLAFEKFLRQIVQKKTKTKRERKIYLHGNFDRVPLSIGVTSEGETKTRGWNRGNSQKSRPKSITQIRNYRFIKQWREGNRRLELPSLWEEHWKKKKKKERTRYGSNVSETTHVLIRHSLPRSFVRSLARSFARPQSLASEKVATHERPVMRRYKQIQTIVEPSRDGCAGGPSKTSNSRYLFLLQSPATPRWAESV